jgi:uncharacterized protein with GYD domain
MMTFIMVTRLAPSALTEPHSIEELEQQAVSALREAVPDLEWMSNFAIMGPFDYVDVFRAPDLEAAMKVSAIVRSFGHAHTEIWPATEWGRFKELVKAI